MNRGDIFEFNGDRFVARDTSGTTVVASKLGLDKNGVEHPRVGKPRTFKNLDAKVVGFMKLVDRRKPGTGHTSFVESPTDEDEASGESPEEAPAEDSWEEIQRKKKVVENLMKLTGDGPSEW